MSKSTDQRWYDIIRSPVVTEKATQGAENNQVTFKVARDSTKPQIKAAVEGLFGVKVMSVNTINVHGKVKMFKGRRGQRASWKKAVVRIAEGQHIDVMTGV